MIANAVIYYNTALLSKVYEQKVAAGDLDAIAFIQGMSPVAGSLVVVRNSIDPHLNCVCPFGLEPDRWMKATAPT